MSTQAVQPFQDKPQPAATGLSPAQVQAAMSLAHGATITAAATTLGVHRSTIYNWFKTDPAFQTAVEEIRRERSERVNDQMRELDALALRCLRVILQDDHAPAGVRLRAASMVLTRPKTSLGEEWHMPDMENLDRTLNQRPSLARPPTFDTLRHNATDSDTSEAPPAFHEVRHNPTPAQELAAAAPLETVQIRTRPAACAGSEDTDKDLADDRAAKLTRAKRDTGQHFAQLPLRLRGEHIGKLQQSSVEFHSSIVTAVPSGENAVSA